MHKFELDLPHSLLEMCATIDQGCSAEIAASTPEGQNSQLTVTRKSGDSVNLLFEGGFAIFCKGEHFIWKLNISEVINKVYLEADVKVENSPEDSELVVLDDDVKIEEFSDGALTSADICDSAAWVEDVTRRTNPISIIPQPFESDNESEGDMDMYTTLTNTLSEGMPENETSLSHRVNAVIDLPAEEEIMQPSTVINIISRPALPRPAEFILEEVESVEGATGPIMTHQPKPKTFIVTDQKCILCSNSQRLRGALLRAHVRKSHSMSWSDYTNLLKKNRHKTHLKSASVRSVPEPNSNIQTTADLADTSTKPIASMDVSEANKTVYNGPYPCVYGNDITASPSSTSSSSTRSKVKSKVYTTHRQTPDIKEESPDLSETFSTRIQTTRKGLCGSLAGDAKSEYGVTGNECEGKAKTTENAPKNSSEKQNFDCDDKAPEAGRNQLSNNFRPVMMCPLCKSKMPGCSINTHLRNSHSNHPELGKVSELCLKKYNELLSMKDNVSHAGLTCECGKWFKNTVTLKFHLKHKCSLNTDRVPLHYCGICSYCTPHAEQMVSHKENHKKDKTRYVCDICGKNYSSRSSCNFHRRRAHDVVMLQPLPIRTCDLCGKGFSTKSEYETHLLKHTDIREYVCEQCGKSFKTKTHLTVHHKQVHLGQYPFSCEKCGHGVGRQTYLKKHVCGRVRNLTRKTPKATKANHRPGAVKKLQTDSVMSITAFENHNDSFVSVSQVPPSQLEKFEVSGVNLMNSHSLIPSPPSHFEYFPPDNAADKEN